MKDKDTQLLQEQYSKLFEQKNHVVIVPNQEVWDALDKQSSKTVYIITNERILIKDIGNLTVIVKKTGLREIWLFNKVFVIAENESAVDAYNNSTVFAKDYTVINAWDNSKVFAEDNAYVFANENSYIEASDNVEIQADGNSKVELSGNAKIIGDYRN